MSKDNERASDVRKEVQQQLSIESTLGSLAQSLGTGAPMPNAASSASSGPKTANGVLQPDPHHLDVTSLAGKVPQSKHKGDGTRIGNSGWGQSLLVNNDLKGVEAPESMQKQSSAQSVDLDLDDLSPLIGDILSFRFSENREKEIAQIHAALKSEMTKLCANRVVANTQAKVKTAKNFYYGKTGSLRIEFSILNQKYSMRAEGAFTGDEILYPTVEGDTVVGLVMREGHSGLENATSEFNVTINKGWKE
jgi:hypothetical protein